MNFSLKKNRFIYLLTILLFINGCLSSSNKKENNLKQGNLTVSSSVFIAGEKTVYTDINTELFLITNLTGGAFFINDKEVDPSLVTLKDNKISFNQNGDYFIYYKNETIKTNLVSIFVKAKTEIKTRVIENSSVILNGLPEDVKKIELKLSQTYVKRGEPVFFTVNQYDSNGFLLKNIPFKINILIKNIEIEGTSFTIPNSFNDNDLAFQAIVETKIGLVKSNISKIKLYSDGELKKILIAPIGVLYGDKTPMLSITGVNINGDLVTGIKDDYSYIYQIKNGSVWSDEIETDSFIPLVNNYYKFAIKYKNLRSNTISFFAKKYESPIYLLKLTANKYSLKQGESILFKLLGITEENYLSNNSLSEINDFSLYLNGTEIPTNYIFNKTGIYFIKAKHKNVFSNTIRIEVLPEIINMSVSATKDNIIANGIDTVYFNYKLYDKNGISIKTRPKIFAKRIDGPNTYPTGEIDKKFNTVIPGVYQIDFIHGDITKSITIIAEKKIIGLQINTLGLIPIGNPVTAYKIDFNVSVLDQNNKIDNSWFITNKLKIKNNTEDITYFESPNTAVNTSQAISLTLPVKETFQFKFIIGDYFVSKEYSTRIPNKIILKTPAITNISADNISLINLYSQVFDINNKSLLNINLESVIKNKNTNEITITTASAFKTSVAGEYEVYTRSILYPNVKSNVITLFAYNSISSIEIVNENNTDKLLADGNSSFSLKLLIKNQNGVILSNEEKIKYLDNITILCNGKSFSKLPINSDYIKFSTQKAGFYKFSVLFEKNGEKIVSNNISVEAYDVLSYVSLVLSKQSLLANGIEKTIITPVLYNQNNTKIINSFYYNNKKESLYSIISKYEYYYSKNIDLSESLKLSSNSFYSLKEGDYYLSVKIKDINVQFKSLDKNNVYVYNKISMLNLYSVKDKIIPYNDDSKADDLLNISYTLTNQLGYKISPLKIKDYILAGNFKLMIKNSSGTFVAEQQLKNKEILSDKVVLVFNPNTNNVTDGLNEFYISYKDPETQKEEVSMSLFITVIKSIPEKVTIKEASRVTLGGISYDAFIYSNGNDFINLDSNIIDQNGFVLSTTQPGLTISYMLFDKVREKNIFSTTAEGTYEFKSRVNYNNVTIYSDVFKVRAEPARPSFLTMDIKDNKKEVLIGTINENSTELDSITFLSYTLDQKRTTLPAFIPKIYHFSKNETTNELVYVPVQTETTTMQSVFARLDVPDINVSIMSNFVTYSAIKPIDAINLEPENNFNILANENLSSITFSAMTVYSNNTTNDDVTLMDYYIYNELTPTNIIKLPLNTFVSNVGSLTTKSGINNKLFLKLMKVGKYKIFGEINRYYRESPNGPLLSKKIKTAEILVEVVNIPFNNGGFPVLLYRKVGNTLSNVPFTLKAKKELFNAELVTQVQFKDNNNNSFSIGNYEADWESSFNSGSFMPIDINKESIIFGSDIAGQYVLRASLKKVKKQDGTYVNLSDLGLSPIYSNGLIINTYDYAYYLKVSKGESILNRSGYVFIHPDNEAVNLDIKVEAFNQNDLPITSFNGTGLYVCKPNSATKALFSKTMDLLSAFSVSDNSKKLLTKIPVYFSWDYKPVGSSSIITLTSSAIDIEFVRKPLMINVLDSNSASMTLTDDNTNQYNNRVFSIDKVGYTLGSDTENYLTQSYVKPYMLLNGEKIYGDLFNLNNYNFVTENKINFGVDVEYKGLSFSTNKYLQGNEKPIYFLKNIKSIDVDVVKSNITEPYLIQFKDNNPNPIIYFKLKDKNGDVITDNLFLPNPSIINGETYWQTNFCDLTFKLNILKNNSIIKSKTISFNNAKNDINDYKIIYDYTTGEYALTLLNVDNTLVNVNELSLEINKNISVGTNNITSNIPSTKISKYKYVNKAKEIVLSTSAINVLSNPSSGNDETVVPLYVTSIKDTDNNIELKDDIFSVIDNNNINMQVSLLPNGIISDSIAYEYSPITPILENGKYKIGIIKFKTVLNKPGLETNIKTQVIANSNIYANPSIYQVNLKGYRSISQVKFDIVNTNQDLFLTDVYEIQIEGYDHNNEHVFLPNCWYQLEGSTAKIKVGRKSTILGDKLLLNPMSYEIYSYNPNYYNADPALNNNNLKLQINECGYFSGGNFYPLYREKTDFKIRIKATVPIEGDKIFTSESFIAKNFLKTLKVNFTEGWGNLTSSYLINFNKSNNFLATIDNTNHKNLVGYITNNRGYNITYEATDAFNNIIPITEIDKSLSLSYINNSVLIQKLNFYNEIKTADVKRISSINNDNNNSKNTILFNKIGGNLTYVGKTYVVGDLNLAPTLNNIDGLAIGSFVYDSYVPYLHASSSIKEMSSPQNNHPETGVLTSFVLPKYRAFAGNFDFTPTINNFSYALFSLIDTQRGLNKDPSKGIFENALMGVNTTVYKRPYDSDLDYSNLFKYTKASTYNNEKQINIVEFEPQKVDSVDMGGIYSALSPDQFAKSIPLIYGAQSETLTIDSMYRYSNTYLYAYKKYKDFAEIKNGAVKEYFVNLTETGTGEYKDEIIMFYVLPDNVGRGLFYITVKQGAVFVPYDLSDNTFNFGAKTVISTYDNTKTLGYNMKIILQALYNSALFHKITFADKSYFIFPQSQIGVSTKPLLFNVSNATSILTGEYTDDFRITTPNKIDFVTISENDFNKLLLQRMTSSELNISYRFDAPDNNTLNNFNQIVGIPHGVYSGDTTISNMFMRGIFNDGNVIR